MEGISRGRSIAKRYWLKGQRLLQIVAGRTLRHLFQAIAIALATVSVGLVLANTPLGASLEERFGLAWLFKLRGPVEASNEVIVVGLDRRSAEGLDLPEKIRDWPRDLYAKLIDRLSLDDAPVITFDLIFEREREPQHNVALVDAMSNADRVVLFEAMELQRTPVSDAFDRSIGLLETQRIRPPIKVLAEAAAGLGPFPLPIVPDRVSQAWLFNPGAGGRPTLPAVALQLHTISVFEHWVSLLRRAEALGVDSVPIDATRLGSPIELRRVMMVFRQAFLDDPDLGRRVRSAIDTNDSDVLSKRFLNALTNLYDGPNSRYLNFYGPAGHIRTLSLVDVLDGSRHPDLWKGRAAFVGQSELYEPHNDAFITVFSRSDGVKIAGVEVAATLFANLLDGGLITPSNWWYPSIFIFGITVGTIAVLFPAVWAALACLVIAAIYFLGVSNAFTSSGDWLPTVVPILIQLPFGIFLGLVVQYRQTRQARENLSKAIRYYLPDKIAEGFVDAPVAPLMHDEEAYGICLIADAGGFTRIAETMTSKELKTYLEAYLEILFTAVETHGGRVTDSVGDGITAAWTSSTPDPTIAARACSAALAMDLEIRRFNSSNEERSLPTRIGLSAGWVTIGHVGGSGRFTYTIVGDAVNTASRIEQLNKRLGTRILATRAVVQDNPEFLIRPLGRFRLFGKEQVLEMVELLHGKETRRLSSLRDGFAVALAAFQCQKWQTAMDLFSMLADEFDDEAARFYLETCRSYRDGTSDYGADSRAILLTAK